jgi:hypothetical protein
MSRVADQQAGILIAEQHKKKRICFTTWWNYGIVSSLKIIISFVEQ